MKLTVEMQEVPFSSVTFSELAVKRLDSRRKAPFVITADASRFLERFTPIYAACVAELVDDDRVTGKFHPPFEQAVAYPSVAEFFALPAKQRMEMIDTHFVFDILRLFMDEESSATDLRWEVSDLHAVDLCGTDVVVSGECVATT